MKPKHRSIVFKLFLATAFLVTSACTGKKQDEKQPGSAAPGSQPKVESPAQDAAQEEAKEVKLPGTFALGRAVRSRLAEQKAAANARKRQFDETIGKD